uniref:Filamentous haemagglutinin FhaB/tRNA nuclease CdiA-like TPS domain-containing protein n=1 Tax=Tolypothrix bouteillei VB521301 TaxID=1479485 RepID=A0A0C1QWW3_9CYAN
MAIAGATVISANCALAQITPDSTLPNNSIVTPDGSTLNITGGTQAGGNLFHSFSEFSVPTGGTAFFNNGVDIQNIISRVTGKSVSNIDGLIRANGTANLFLINPNGIVFGQNASLDIGGSFVGSTASSLKFADGFEFNAKTPQTTPLLTISVPTGLQFGGTGGSILNQSQVPNSDGIIVGLQVQPGKTLALVGDNVGLDGGKLTAPGGRVELGGVAGTGQVQLNVDGNRLSLSYPESIARSDIFLTNAARVVTTGEGSGGIQVYGKNIAIKGGSRIESFTLGTQPGEVIKLDASESVEVSGRAADGALVAGTKDSGAGGDLTITAKRLTIQDGAQVGVLTAGSGKSGNINITSPEFVQLLGETKNGQTASGLFSETDSTGIGGDINIITERFIIRDGANLLSYLYGSAAGGNVTITASKFVEVTGIGTVSRYPSALSAEVAPGVTRTLAARATGNGGNLVIQTSRLNILDGGQVGTTTFGNGKAGDTVVSASESIEIIRGITNNSTTRLTVQTQGAGAAGNLKIETDRLVVRGGAQVSAGTFGSGQGGTLEANVSESIELSGTSVNGFSSGLFTQSDRGEGASGDLKIITKRLVVRDGAAVSAGTLAAGQGGKLMVQASDSVEVIGTSANGLIQSRLTTQTQGAGNAGDLAINTQQLLVQDGARVSVTSFGTGTAGNLIVDARSVRLDNNATLTADTQSAKVNPNRGQATININSRDLIVRRGSNIIANATGENVIGGNINIDTDVLVAVENSDISANSANFRGGNVKITTQGIFGTQFRDAPTSKSDITATGGSPELKGSVELNTPDINRNRGLVQLPTNLIDVSQEIANSCNPGNRQRGGSFTETGRGGVAPSPFETLTSDAVQAGWISLNPNIDNNKSPSTFTNPTTRAPERIVEATSWVRNAKGEVVLTANAPVVSGGSWQNPVSCKAS